MERRGKKSGSAESQFAQCALVEGRKKNKRKLGHLPTLRGLHFAPTSGPHAAPAAHFFYPGTCLPPMSAPGKPARYLVLGTVARRVHVGHCTLFTCEITLCILFSHCYLYWLVCVCGRASLSSSRGGCECVRRDPRTVCGVFARPSFRLLGALLMCHPISVTAADFNGSADGGESAVQCGAHRKQSSMSFN